MTTNEFLRSLSDFLWTFGWIGTFLLMTKDDHNKDDKK